LTAHFLSWLSGQAVVRLARHPPGQAGAQKSGTKQAGGNITIGRRWLLRCCGANQ